MIRITGTARRMPGNRRPLRSPWRDKAPADTPERPFTVRMKMPSDGSTTIEDAVQGAVTIQNKVWMIWSLRGDGSNLHASRGCR